MEEEVRLTRSDAEQVLGWMACTQQQYQDERDKPSMRQVAAKFELAFPGIIQANCMEWLLER